MDREIIAMLKRLFDLIVSMSGLLFLFPVLFVVSIGVLITSQGPILFWQERVGLAGKIFKICKFRTMIVDAERVGPKITIGSDTRITKFGSILRKYKIDELPQLANVFVGDMSIVGPRPEVLEYIELYPSEIKELVLSVRPGITDQASLTFKDESTLISKADDPHSFYVNEILPIKQKYYVDYVKNRNMLIDLKIVFHTIGEIFIKR